MAMSLRPQQPMKPLKTQLRPQMFARPGQAAPKPQQPMKPVTPLTPAAAAPSARQAPQGAKPGSLVAAPNIKVSKSSPDGIDMMSHCVTGKGGKKLRLKPAKKDVSVKKSYVPGKGFVSASTLTKPQYRSLLTGRQYRPKPDIRMRDQANQIKLTNRSFDSAKKEAGVTSGVKDGVERIKVPGLSGAGYRGMAWKQGGKKTGKKQYMYDPNIDRGVRGATKAHELAHVAPKSRTSWRLSTISNDPKKMMREEARANMAAGQYYARNQSKAKKSSKALIAANNAGELSGTQYRRAVKYLRTKDTGSYNEMAVSGPTRRAHTESMRGGPQAALATRFSGRSMREYRKTQNKIARAKGMDKDFRIR